MSYVMPTADVAAAKQAETNMMRIVYFCFLFLSFFLRDVLI